MKADSSVDNKQHYFPYFHTMKFTCFFMAAILFFGTFNTPAQNRPGSIIVLPVKMAVPEGAKKLGAIKLGNNATATNCDYEALINNAKEKASAMGGNMVKITHLIAPAFIGKCYKIEADVYYVNNLPHYKTGPSGNNTVTGRQDNNYALLCIYRLKDTIAFATPYKVHLNNDSVICTVKSKSRDSVKLYDQDTVTLWAETEKRQELKLDVKPGATYYIRCGLTMGEIRMVPVLDLMDKDTGEKEYGEARKKNKNADVNYLQQIH